MGLGTTSVGAITETGNINLIEVNRGYIGSAATNHSTNDVTRLFSGGYNIDDSTVHFTEAPREQIEHKELHLFRTCQV